MLIGIYKFVFHISDRRMPGETEGSNCDFGRRCQFSNFSVLDVASSLHVPPRAEIPCNPETDSMECVTNRQKNAGFSDENHSVCLFFKAIIKHLKSRHHNLGWLEKHVECIVFFFLPYENWKCRNPSLLTSMLRLTASANLHSIVKFKHFEMLTFRGFDKVFCVVNACVVYVTIQNPVRDGDFV